MYDATIVSWREKLRHNGACCSSCCVLTLWQHGAASRSKVASQHSLLQPDSIAALQGLHVMHEGELGPTLRQSFDSLLRLSCFLPCLNAGMLVCAAVRPVSLVRHFYGNTTVKAYAGR